MTSRGVLPCLLLVGSFGVYLLNGHFVESTDTVGNELLPISILQHGSLTFDQYFTPVNPDGRYPTGDLAIVPGSVPSQFAYRVLPEAPGKSFPWWFVRSGQHIVSLYPIATGLVNTPVFFIANLMGVGLAENVVPLTRITAALVAAFSVLAMYLCLVQVGVPRRTTVYLTFGFAFGTAVWSLNSRSLFQHGAAVLFLTLALAALLTRRPRLIALAGLLLGLAVVVRPTNGIIAVGLAIYVFRHERRGFPGFAALAGVAAALLAWYSWVYWGNPLALGQGQGLSGFLATEPIVALAGLAISPNRGLLIFSPIFIFSVAYAGHLVRHRTGLPLLHYLIWSSVGVYALYTLWGDWAGGHAYGYRFLIELTPGLMLILGAGWRTFIQPRPVVRGLFLLATLASVYVSGLGATAAPCGFDDEPNNIDAHHERLWDIADGEIVRCTRQELTALQSAASHGTS